MVPHVAHVIVHPPVECRRWIASDYAGRPQPLSRNRLHRRRDLPIESRPQIHELRPWPLAVAVRGNPGLLFVAGPGERINKSRAHEALMIVGRRIDQMAEDLLADPFAGTPRF